MAGTYRIFTTSSDFSTVARYLRHISVADFTADPGAVSRVLVRNGSTSGDIVLDIRLAANDSKHISFPKPLFFPAGVYVQVSVGTVRGSIDAD